VSDPAVESRTVTESELFLDDLMTEVRRTRSELRTALDSHRGMRAFEVVEARQQSAAALESFVAALDERLLPVPRQIRDELRLMRSLSARS
jgi:hypothetical protein